MGNNNLPQVNINADLTDVIKEGYEDTTQKPLQSSSGVVTTVIDFFHNTVLYPMQKYNLYAKSKLENFAKELQENAEKIPAENLIEPKVNILGPVMEGLKYNLNEEHIKEMFQNILLADMDNRQQSRVLPAYIEIVKQLSKDDAEFLFSLKQQNMIHNLPILRVKLVDDKGHFVYISDYVICLDNGKYIKVNPLILDNFIRLNIFHIPYDLYIPSIDYTAVFEKLKNEPQIKRMCNTPGKHLEYDKEKINFTAYGTNFIDICLS